MIVLDVLGITVRVLKIDDVPSDERPFCDIV